MIIMSEEESDATTTYPDIESFQNNEVEDHENNHDIRLHSTWVAHKHNL